MKPVTPTKNPAAVALGALGGSARTARKSAAARRNGRKGGRPRLQPLDRLFKS